MSNKADDILTYRNYYILRTYLLIFVVDQIVEVLLWRAELNTWHQIDHGVQTLVVLHQLRHHHAAAADMVARSR